MNQSHGVSGHVAIQPFSVDTVFLSKDVLLPDEHDSPSLASAAATAASTVVDGSDAGAGPVASNVASEKAHTASTSVMGIAVTVHAEPCASTHAAAPVKAEIPVGRRDRTPESDLVARRVRAAPIDGCHFLLSLPDPIEPVAPTVHTCAIDSARQADQAASHGSHIEVASLLPAAHDAMDVDELVHPTPAAARMRVVAHLPFTRFGDVVRDYTAPTVRFNDTVLNAAWEEKVGWRATSPLVVSDDDERAGEPQGTREAPVRPSSSVPAAEVVRPVDVGDQARSRRFLWEEAAVVEAHYQQRLRHRFLVSDPDTSHAIWALDVHMPSGTVSVVSPADFFGGTASTPPLCTGSAAGTVAMEEEGSLPRATPLNSLARTEGSPDVPADARTVDHTSEAAAVTEVGRFATSTGTGHAEEAERTAQETPQSTRAAAAVSATSADRAQSPSVPHAASSVATAVPHSRAMSGSMPTSVEADTTHTSTVDATPLTREPTTRTRSASSTAAAVRTLTKHTSAPIMGGACGFVDGHMSIARFNRPTALCWRIDEAAPAPATASTPAHLRQEEGSARQSSADPSLSSPFPAHALAGAADSGNRADSAWAGSACEMLFISDSGNHAIRYANFRNRLVRTVAGLSGVPGYRDGSCTSSLLANVTAMAWCSSGLVFADGPNGVVRLVTGITHRPSTIATDTASAESSLRRTMAPAAQFTSGPPAGTGAVTTVELSPQAVVADVAGGMESSTPPRTPLSTQSEAVNSPEGMRTPVRVPVGLPPRSPRTPSPSPSPASKYSQQQQQQRQKELPRLIDTEDPQGLAGRARSRHVAESREASLRRPRVWTVAGAPPVPRGATTSSRTDRAIHHIDAPLPQRASLGYPADIALWPGEVDASVARVLIADAAFSAVRVLDREGVRTVVSPMDYPTSPDENDADGPPAAPPGLWSVGGLWPLAIIQERVPWMPQLSDTPEPYLHTSHMVLLVGSASANAISLLRPTDSRVLERLALDVHAEVVKAEKVGEDTARGADEETDAEAAKRDRLFQRVARRVEEEEQRLVEVGISATGRRTVGELGLPSLRRLVMPMIEEALGMAPDEAHAETSLIEEAARRAAHQRAREQYLRLSFPFVLTPALVHTDHRTFPHLYCFMSGSRGRVCVDGLHGDRAWGTSQNRSKSYVSHPRGANALFSPQTVEQSRQAAHTLLSTMESSQDGAEAGVSVRGAQDLLFSRIPRAAATVSSTAKGAADAPTAGYRHTSLNAYTNQNSRDAAEWSPPRARATVGPERPDVTPPSSQSSPASAPLPSVADGDSNGNDDGDDELTNVSVVSGTSSMRSDAPRSVESAEQEEVPRAYVSLSRLCHTRGAGNRGGVSCFTLDAYATAGFEKLSAQERRERAARVEADVRMHWAQRSAGKKAQRRHRGRPHRLDPASKRAGDDTVNMSRDTAVSAISAVGAARQHARAAKKVAAVPTRARGLARRGPVATKRSAARGKDAKTADEVGANGGENAMPVPTAESAARAQTSSMAEASAHAAASTTAATREEQAVASLYALFRLFADRSVEYCTPGAEARKRPAELSKPEEGLGVARASPRTRRTTTTRGTRMPVEATSGLLITPRAGQCGRMVPGRATASPSALVRDHGTDADADAALLLLSAPSSRVPTPRFTVALTSLWRLLFHLGVLARPTQLATTGTPSWPPATADPEASHSNTPHDPLNGSLPSFTRGFGLSQEARARQVSAPSTVDRRGAFKSAAGAVPRAKGAASAARSEPPCNVMLPISTQDWRSLVECLYTHTASCSAASTTSLTGRAGEGLDFAAFRRVLLLLWLWEKTVDTQAGLHASLQEVTRAYADRHRSTLGTSQRDGGDRAEVKSEHAADQSSAGTTSVAEVTAQVDALTHIRETAARLDSDIAATRFGWVDRLPLLHTLTEAQVAEAYEDMFNRAVRCVPGFVAELNAKSSRSGDVWGQPSAFAEATSQSTLASALPADTTDGLTGISPIPKARAKTASSTLLQTCVSEISGEEVADDAATAPQAPLGDVHTPSVVKVVYPPAVTAADALLRLLGANERAFRSLFQAYSEITVVRRSATYSAPFAVAHRAAPNRGDAEGSASPMAAPHTARLRATKPTSPLRSGDGEEQDVLWKIGQLLGTAAEEPRAARHSRVVDVRAVPYVALRALMRTLDVFPSLISRVSMEVVFMDALSRPLWPSSSATVTAARNVGASELAGAATRVDVEDTPFIDTFTRDHSALTYLAFIEAFVRVAFTVFSQLGEADQAAYPSARSKVVALMTWVNQQVALGHVERTTRAVTREGGPTFPLDFPLFRSLN